MKKKNLEPSHLKSHIGYRMRIVSNAVSHTFARKLAAHDVTVAEWVILREMYSQKGITAPSAVADITGLTRGAVSKLIDRLLGKGLVTRAESVSDRRYQDIQLTSKATKLIPKLAKIADENDASFFSHLSMNEKNLLLEILIQLAEHHKLKINPID